METWIRVVLAFLLAVAGGGISAAVAVSHERLCALISLAAGTLLGVTVFAILPGSWTVLPVWELFLAVASGYVVFWLISKYVYHVCPACAASHFDESTTHRFQEIATAMIIALAIHSTLDGLALAVGSEAHHGGPLDWSLVVAICVHKVPEGLALGALLIGSGFRRAGALSWVSAVEATTILGGAIGILGFANAGAQWVHLLLAHAGGGFLFLAIHAVMGEMLKHGKKTVLLNFLAGVALIGIVNVLLHGHE